MKKLVSFVLTIAIVLGMTASALAAPYTGASIGKKNTQMPFDDAPTNAVATVLRDLGVLTGNENGEAMLDKPISRGEFCTMIVKALGLEPLDGEVASKRFSDVKADDWFAGYVARASADSIVNGKGDGSYFAPLDYVSADEALAFLIKALGYTEEGLSGTWPLKYRNLAMELNIIPADFDFDATEIARKTVFEVLYKALDVKLVKWNKTYNRFDEVDSTKNTMNKLLGASYDTTSVYSMKKKIVNQYDIEDIKEYSGFDASDYLGVTAFVLYKKYNPIALGQVLAASNGAVLSSPAAITGTAEQDYAFVLAVNYLDETKDLTAAAAPGGEGGYQFKLLPVGSDTPVFFTNVSTSAIGDDCFDSSTGKFSLDDAQVVSYTVRDGKLSYIRPAISGYEYKDVSGKYFDTSGVDGYIFSEDVKVSYVKSTTAKLKASDAGRYDSWNSYSLVNSKFSEAYIFTGLGGRISHVVAKGDTTTKAGKDIIGTDTTEAAVETTEEAIEWHYAFVLAKGDAADSGVTKLGGFDEGEKYVKFLDFGSSTPVVYTDITTDKSFYTTVFSSSIFNRIPVGSIATYAVQGGQLYDVQMAKSGSDYVNASNIVFANDSGAGYSFKSSTRFIKLLDVTDTITEGSIARYSAGSSADFNKQSWEEAYIFSEDGNTVDTLVYGGKSEKATQITEITFAAIRDRYCDTGGDAVNMLVKGSVIKKYSETDTGVATSTNLYNLTLDYDKITAFKPITKSYMKVNFLEYEDFGDSTTGVVYESSMIKYTNSGGNVTWIPLVNPYIIIYDEDAGYFKTGSTADIKDGVTKIIFDSDADWYCDFVILNYKGD